MSNDQPVGPKLREAIRRAGLSRSEVARAVGVSPTALYFAEGGDTHAALAQQALDEIPRIVRRRRLRELRARRARAELLLEAR